MGPDRQQPSIGGIMGLNASDIESVVRLRKQGYFAGARSIVELGIQQLSHDLLVDQSVFQEIGQAFDVPARNFLEPSPDAFPHREMADLKQGMVTREFWEWLGFSYACIDVAGSPGAVPLDLNFDSVPEHMRNAFALVTNIGNSTHFVNQLNAFKVMHDLCKSGGVMLHHLPAEGFMTHGLVKYDPKFFWMLSRSNGYKWLDLDFRVSDARQKIHHDVISELRRFHPDADSRAGSYSIADGTLFVVFQKLYDIEFVPPLDVPNGTMPNSELSERYWTVFQPKRFQELIEKEEEKRAKAAKSE
jgi:SAM-dependent methyltransferase